MGFVLEQGETASNGDQSESSAIFADWKKDHGDWKYWANSALVPGYGNFRALTGRKEWKKKRAALEKWRLEQAKRQRARDYSAKLDQLSGEQLIEDNARNDALAAVDDPLSLANDEAEIEGAYEADIGNRYAGLAEDFGRSSQNQGLAAARRGVLGGSNDAEQGADLAAGFQSRLIDADQAALGRSSNDRRAREDSRSSLRRSILTGDAAQSAAWTERARGEGAQSERESRMMDYMNAFQGLKQQQAEDNSRLMGGAASAFGDSYRLDQSAKADGGVGLY
jgi:hypothetical protein